jgi:hypothetical protein
MFGVGPDSTRGRESANIAAGVNVFIYTRARNTVLTQLNASNNRLQGGSRIFAPT